MSDPKIISPMLDGFAMGGAMSDHDGVRCYPAMKENSDHKYIVKVISIPASQNQLDALLLTGAYKDPAAALDYFKSLSDDVVAEAEVLQKLSKLEGFLPYESWQVIPMENNSLGYQVYLLSSYKQSLEKFMRRNAMTHLAAVNLGLDMCAALAIARNAGYLFVDLKPSNIFVSEDKEYRLGDLGFVKLDSLKYASLPSKYRSAYTAPEMEDPMTTLNETVDTYAAGMILYQVYNNGILPTEPNTPENPLPTPLNADYEIAEIIMKAIAPDARDRWENPMAMGQALVSYMQRNTVNDVPINPPMAAMDEPVALAEEPASQEESPEAPHEELKFLENMVSDETAPDESDAETISQDVTEEVTSMLDQAEDLISHQIPDAAISTETINISAIQEIADSIPANEAAQEPLPTVPVFQEETPVSDKTMVMDPEKVKQIKPGFHIFDEVDDYDDYDEDADDEDLGDPVDMDKPRKKANPLVILLVLLLIGASVVGGLFFYRNYYLLSIDGLKVDGSNNQITVSVDTDIDESLLTVVCSDTYGNTKRMTLKDGEAVFTELTPDTVYHVQLEVSGFHKLTGPSYSSYITAAETKITSFTGITDSEDGSVKLEFKVEGPEKTPDWQVSYSAEGEETKTHSFTGHTTTITGLTVGKVYTFQLIPATELYMVGESTLEFTASKIILAENLKITACADGKLTAQWEAPADTAVESWSIRCYSEDGVEQVETTTDTAFTFENIQPGMGYTVEVTAAGMTKSAPAVSISANPITVTNISVDSETPGVLNVTWEFQGEAPEGGWHLMYTLDNNTDQRVVRSDSNSATIDLRIPGSVYHITIQAASGTTIFCDELAYTCPDAEKFNKYELPYSKIAANLLVTPSKSNWSYKDVGKKDYTETFKVGQNVSLLLRGTVDFYIPRDETSVLCYVKDSQGNVITSTIYTDSDTWYNLWNNSNYHYFELDVTNTPQTPGEYTVYLLFNNQLAADKTFTIKE